MIKDLNNLGGQIEISILPSTVVSASSSSSYFVYIEDGGLSGAMRYKLIQKRIKKRNQNKS